MIESSVETSGVNQGRLNWDLKSQGHASGNGQYEKYWAERNIQVLPPELFENKPRIWLEVGAGSGWFFVEMARQYPDTFLIAIERSKERGRRLVRKAGKSGLNNIAAFRGNAIPALIHCVPTASVDRVYILYPCPWQKNAQRKNRWYLHPIMPHLVRILKEGGLLIWASDQKFYIDEAHFVCREKYGLTPLAHGELAPNPYNDLDRFPGGRTKFESSFLTQGQPCYELVVRKDNS